MGVVFLADSNITKRALSTALKELMENEPFSKISVGDICEKCEMNRKSFYYHFRDKYDLVSWIYDTECIAALRQKECSSGWEMLEELSAYFYENRSFYRKILDIDGQNSFSEYFREMMASVISEDMEESFGQGEASAFYVNFYSDAFLCAVKRWLLDKDCIPAERFSALLKSCLLDASDAIVRRFSEQ